MRIELLHEFIVLAVQLNYTSAAKHLRVSQPNLSRHILDLERELGVELFVREPSVRLTPAGVVFLDDAVRIIRLYRESRERCRNVYLNTGEETVVQEPHFIDAMGEIVYSAARVFRNEHPLEPIRLHTEQGKKSVDLLEAQSLDIAISVDSGRLDRLMRHGDKKGMIYVPILREPLVTWLHKNHPLASRDSLTLDDLLSTPITVTAARHLDPFRFSVVSFLESSGSCPILRTRACATLAEFYVSTQDEDSAFIVTSSTVRNPILRMQDWMVTLPIDDQGARQVSYLVLRSDYAKQGIDLFLGAIEKVVTGQIAHEPGVQYLADIAD